MKVRAAHMILISASEHEQQLEEKNYKEIREGRIGINIFIHDKLV